MTPPKVWHAADLGDGFHNLEPACRLCLHSEADHYRRVRRLRRTLNLRACRSSHARVGPVESGCLCPEWTP